MQYNVLDVVAQYVVSRKATEVIAFVQILNELFRSGD